MSESSSGLALSGFGVCFGRRVVLASVDLDLPAHGIDVLIGPAKAGKSTLMRSLAGLNDVASLYRRWGQAALGGRSIDSDLRPVLVQQHAAALSARLRDALVLRARQRGERSGKDWAAAAAAALAEHGLAHLEPQLDQSVLSLPPEWQRAVNILSFALEEPPVLMIDAPTQGLDELAAGRLIDWLKLLGSKVKLLVSLHRQAQARRLGDRVVLLGDGRVLAHESAESFFARPPNAWAERFVRTGSLANASAVGHGDRLNPAVEAPPPLPQAALDALAEFAPPGASAPAAPALAPLPPSQAVAAADPAQGWETTVPGALWPATVSGAPLPPHAPRARHSRMAASAAQPAKVSVPMPEATAAPQRLLARRRAALPPLSAQGVSVAAQVGRGSASDYRGPPGFSWIVPGRLAGCAEPGVMSSIDYDLDLLVGVGITRLVTLTEKDLPQDTLKRHGLENLHLPIYDREAPTIRQIYMLVRRMQLLLDEGHVLAVHCKAGIGRTGTVLASWLIREGGIGADEAIQRLRAIKSTYVQSEVQEKFLHEFERDILQHQ